MPTGWTAAQPASTDLTCVGTGCSLVTSSGPIEVSMGRSATGFTLAVQVTPPASAGSAGFTATENWVDPNSTVQATSAPVTVICPADGLGTMAVNPSTVAVASSGTFTFTYTAGSCAAGPDGMAGVTVPGGWTPPGTAAATAGNLASGAQVSFTYGPVQASSTGPATFSAWQSAAGGLAQDLAAAPVVMVTQPQVARSSAATAASTPASTPASTTASTTASTPASTPASTTASTTASTPASTQASSPASAPAQPPSSHTPRSEAGGQPVALVAGGLSAGGLVLLAALAGLLASRSRRRAGRLRRGRPGAAGGDVRAVPHAGPPASVAVRDTGTRPALTVRIEPHAGATVTTIEEKRP